MVYSMAASGSNLGNDDFIEVVTPSPPISNTDVRMTAILEQLVRSNEAQMTIQAQHREHMAKSHEAQMEMQAQITFMLQVQSQMQAQMHTTGTTSPTAS